MPIQVHSFAGAVLSANSESTRAGPAAQRRLPKGFYTPPPPPHYFCLSHYTIKIYNHRLYTSAFCPKRSYHRHKRFCLKHKRYLFDTPVGFRTTLISKEWSNEIA
jgi:hypothetical protein